MPRIDRPAAKTARVMTLAIIFLTISPLTPLSLPARADDLIDGRGAPSDAAIERVARASGTPDIPGLHVVWLSPLGDPARANHWLHILAHQTEGPAGSARQGALEQSKNPTRRGVTIWVETDGTVYWATPETAIPTHGEGADRNDNKYIDNGATFHRVVKSNTIGVEFAGNFPDVTKAVTAEQMQAWLVLVRFLQARYGIPSSAIYAHNWIDFKDARYCEGCELAKQARSLDYHPSSGE